MLWWLSNTGGWTEWVWAQCLPVQAGAGSNTLHEPIPDIKVTHRCVSSEKLDCCGEFQRSYCSPLNILRGNDQKRKKCAVQDPCDSNSRGRHWSPSVFCATTAQRCSVVSTVCRLLFMPVLGNDSCTPLLLRLTCLLPTPALHAWVLGSCTPLLLRLTCLLPTPALHARVLGSCTIHYCCG